MLSQSWEGRWGQEGPWTPGWASASFPWAERPGGRHPWPHLQTTPPAGHEAREELPVARGSAGSAVQAVLPPRAGSLCRPPGGDLPVGLGEATKERLPPGLPRREGESGAGPGGRGSGPLALTPWAGFRVDACSEQVFCFILPWTTC